MAEPGVGRGVHGAGVFERPLLRPGVLRFVSPDPLLKPMDPRTLDAYRYAENNPITYTDASGLSPCSGLPGGAEAACLKMYYNGMKSVGIVPPSPGKATTYTAGHERQAKLRAIAIMAEKQAKANAEAAKFSWRHDVWDIAKPVLAGAATALVVGTVCLGGGAVTGGVMLVACSAFAGASGALAHYYVATPSDQWNGGDARKAAAWGALWGGATGGAFWGASYLASVYPESTFLGAPSWMSSGSGSVAADSAADVLATPQVASPKLQNIVNDLYKGTTNPGRVGNGTTMDAIANELETGLPTAGKFHSIKGQDSLNGLNNWLGRNPSAPYQDRLVAQSLADELSALLGGAG